MSWRYSHRKMPGRNIFTVVFVWRLYRVCQAPLFGAYTANIFDIAVWGLSNQRDQLPRISHGSVHALARQSGRENQVDFQLLWSEQRRQDKSGRDWEHDHVAIWPYGWECESARGRSRQKRAYRQRHSGIFAIWPSIEVGEYFFLLA